MAPAGLPMALVVSFLALFLLWRYREHFAGLMKTAVRNLSIASPSNCDGKRNR